MDGYNWQQSESCIGKRMNMPNAAVFNCRSTAADGSSIFRSRLFLNPVVCVSNAVTCMQCSEWSHLVRLDSLANLAMLKLCLLQNKVFWHMQFSCFGGLLSYIQSLMLPLSLTWVLGSWCVLIFLLVPYFCIYSCSYEVTHDAFQC